MIPVTPSFPLPPRPTGQLTLVPDAHLRLPLRRDLGEVVGEDVGGARAIRAARHRDALVRELHPGVVGGDRRIVPLGDLAEEDAGQRLGREPEVLHPWSVVSDHVGTEDRWDVDHVGNLRNLIVLHRGIARAEVDRPVRELLDAATRPDGLVVEFDVRVKPVVLAEPLGIDGEREGRARSIDEQTLRRRHGADQQHGPDEHLLHDVTPLVVREQIDRERSNGHPWRSGDRRVKRPY